MSEEIKDTIEILDKTLKHGFCQIPRSVLRTSNLSMQAKVVYALLLDYAWQKEKCFPGQDRLAKDLGVHRNTVQKFLKELKESGLISWCRRGLKKTNIYYILPLSKALDKTSDAQGCVHPEAQKRVQPDAQGTVHKVEEDKYKKKEYKKPLTLSNANGKINLNSFDSEAVALAKELSDEKSIKYYQNLINRKNKGEIKQDDIQSALNDTRRMIRTDQVDGTTFLKNPAGWFVSILKKLMQKNDERRKQEKYQNMINKFKESFITKSQL